MKLNLKFKNHNNYLAETIIHSFIHSYLLKVIQKGHNNKKHIKNSILMCLQSTTMGVQNIST